MRCIGLLLALVACRFGVEVNALAATPDDARRFEFHEPRPVTYQVAPTSASGVQSIFRPQWLHAWRADDFRQAVELGSRVVLQLSDGRELPRLLADSRLRRARAFNADVFVLQAPDAWTALSEAQRLSQQPGVVACYPVRRRPARLHGAYAAQPNDPYFNQQWNFENRDPNTGARLGADLNVRAAWPSARGAGVTIAIVDDGVDQTHPELAPRIVPTLNYNFNTGETNGAPASNTTAHGTAVAGLAVAEGYNQTGMIGAAYRAGLASWVIFSDLEVLPSEEVMADMFQYQSNAVAVQNHSWGNASATPLEVGLLERLAISNAVTFGRQGRGVVLVRSGGNGRVDRLDANDDGYLTTPLVIPVAAVRFDGRAASYSNPGANLLVAAPSGDPDAGFPTVFTTDLRGTNGFNQNIYTNDLADYLSGSLGFSGTSAAAPQIAGVAALLLSANPRLTYRDVQQVLIFSSRIFDPADPDLATNGAGFRISHNVGFGVPDAGFAVTLARRWPNRPAATNVTFTSTQTQAIPDAGFRLLVTGDTVPTNLTSIIALPSEGPYADRPTAVLPLVDVGLALAPITNNLTGAVALIRRGTNLFSDKITKAAQAGAAFAVVYNNQDPTQLIHMAETDFTPIPAAFISQNDGEALRGMLQQGQNLRGQLSLQSVTYPFLVTNTLLLEHVAVRLQTDHQRRGDLRVTLLSPQGTRSVLQHGNPDDAPGPADWTYYSTHHFYESSAGVWQVNVGDETPVNTGAVQSVSLILRGVPIVDTDHDGLDDDWEMAQLGTLAFGPQDDPNQTGFSLMQDQILGLAPTLKAFLFQLDLSLWNGSLARLSWPGNVGRSYQLLTGGMTSAVNVITNLPGVFPQTEWFTPYTNLPQQFFRLRTTP